MGKHQRNGVEWQGRPSTPSQRIGAHAESTMTRPPCLSLYTCAPFSWAIDRAGPARSTPFLCSCAKKRGGAPKKRAFGCRHGSCWVPPTSPTDSKPQHHRRLRQADLSARSTTSPLPKSGEDDPRPPRQQRSREWWSRRGKKSAFLWRLDTVSLGKHQRNGVESQQGVKTTSQGNGAHVQTKRKRGNPRRGFPLRPPPALK